MNLEELDKKYNAMSEEEKKKMYESIPEEDKKIFYAKKDFITKNFADIMIAKTIPSLENAVVFATIGEEYCKKFNCGMDDFFEFTRTFIYVFTQQSIENLGASFDEKVHYIPDSLKKKNRDNKKKIEKEKFDKKLENVEINKKQSTGNTMAHALKKAGVVK